MTPAGGRRTGAGRKPYESPSQIRKARSIRFSDPEWAQLNQQAKENGYQNISDYLRSLAKLNNLENKLENNKEETKMLNQLILKKNYKKN